jgi:YidC/Oxa1 family membrane protein insertase
MIDKRTLITIAVCFGIFLGWNFLFPPKPTKKAAQAATQPASIPTADFANANGVFAPSGDKVATIAAAAASQPTVMLRGVHVEDEHVRVDVQNIGAALRDVTLKGYREGGKTRGEEKHPVQLIPDFAGQPLEGALFLLDNAPFPFSDVETDAKQGATAKGAFSGLAANAHWQLDPLPYVMRLDVELKNESDTPKTVNAALKLSGVLNEKKVKDKGMFEPPPDMSQALAYVDDKLFKHEQGKPDTLPPGKGLAWAGIDRQYFLLAAAPVSEGAQPASARFEEQRSPIDTMLIRMSSIIDEAPRTLAPGATTKYAYRVFAGPKSTKLLAAAGNSFEDAVDYKVWFMPLGFLARPMLWILNHAYGLVHSWGLAILFLTLILKLVLFPVTQKSYVSMQKMKDLKPDLDKIKERFPGDREKQGMETMKLYKERGISPLGGCLPMLLQMPIYLAMWRMLWSAVELYQQEFLWLGDLTAKDPYYVLPLLLGVTFFIQQKISPPAGDPQQQKIMMFMMPPLMTLFMVQLSSGLVFYYLVNTVLTIAQQAYISRKFSQSPTPVAASKRSA